MERTYKQPEVSLNPCCNGIYLIIQKKVRRTEKTVSLNPCCNGIYLIIIFSPITDSNS